jgi:hypothetical protein
VNAGAHVDACLIGVPVGILLALECLDVAAIVLVDIVGDSHFAVFAAFCVPAALANGHGLPPVL